MKILQSARRTRSPPESIFTVLKTSSPENKKAPKLLLASKSVRVGNSFKKSCKTVSLLEYCAICWSKYPICTRGPNLYSPASLGTSPIKVLIKVDFPSPFPPIIPTLLPRFISRLTVESGFSYPTHKSLTESTSFTPISSGVKSAWNVRKSYRSGESMVSIFSSCFSLL